MTNGTGQTARRGLPWRTIGWSVPAILLLVPLVAGAPWTAGDYLFAAIVFAGIGGAAELAARASTSPFYRAGAAVALLAGFLLVWISAAVGIIGDEGDPANLLYAGVLAIAVVGAIAARGRPRGLARTMGLAAIAQVTVATIALAGGLGAAEPPGSGGILAINAVFVALFAASAALFARAAR